MSAENSTCSSSSSTSASICLRANSRLSRATKPPRVLARPSRSRVSSAGASAGAEAPQPRQALLSSVRELARRGSGRSSASTVGPRAWPWPWSSGLGGAPRQQAAPAAGATSSLCSSGVSRGDPGQWAASPTRVGSGTGRFPPPPGWRGRSRDPSRSSRAFIPGIPALDYL